MGPTRFFHGPLMTTPPPPSESEKLQAAHRILSAAQSFLDASHSLRDIHVLTERMVAELLQRDSDRPLRDKTLAHVAAYFRHQLAASGPTARRLEEARHFTQEVLALILPVRRSRGEAPPAPTEIDGYLAEEQVAVDTDDCDTEADSALMEASADSPAADAPTRIILVPPPHPEKHEDFPSLLAAALRYRVGVITSYFQRWNPRVSRVMPLPFLLAVPFGERLNRLMDEVIAPAMLDSRPVRVLATRHVWNQMESKDFWTFAEQQGHMDCLRLAWQDAWNRLRPHLMTRAGHQVLKSHPALADLRARLASEDYALPRIGNREIDLLSSFLDPAYARTPLEQAWTKLRQTYEQELDRRVYQDQARAGALRDSLLACFQPFTNPTAEFLAMLCYWNFPHLTLSFLTAFTHNHGTNREQRLRRIPYLMWYLDRPEAEQALVEDDALVEKVSRRAALRKQQAREEEERARDATLGGVSWKA